MKSQRFFIVVIMSVVLMLALACSISTSSQEPDIEFFADRISIQEGECVTFFWAVGEESQVKFNNTPEQNSGSDQVCPNNTTTYALSVKYGEDTIIKKVTILVQKKAAQPAPAQNNDADQPFEAYLNFWADRTTINKGECTNLHWQTSFPGVWIGEKQYPPQSQMEVCPSISTEYNAEIGDQVIEKQIVIQIVENGAPQQAQQPSAQQQPAQQQPTAQQPAAPNQGNPSLTFTTIQDAATCRISEMIYGSTMVSGAKTVLPGKEIELRLNQPANVAVYIAGKGVPKKVSSDGKTINITIPSNFEKGFIELKGDNIYAKSDTEVVSMWFNLHLESDLAVTDLFPNNMPVGQVYTRITNRGPAGIVQASIDLICNATLSPQPGVFAPATPINITKNYTVTIPHNATYNYDTGISNDTDTFRYTITCSVRPHEATYFNYYDEYKVAVSEKDNSNNSYTEVIPQ